MNQETRPKNIENLENIRQSEGNEKCKDFFTSICKENKERAANLLNQENLSFPSLFILLPIIEEEKIENSLSKKNKTAHQITKQILGSESNQDILSEKNSETADTLRWILESGHNEYALDDRYLKVLDIACSVLIVIYEEKNIQNLMDKMIFERHKRGLCLHELVWAFFQIKDFSTVHLIAEHLQADDEEEALFACKLLHLPNTAKEERANQYSAYIDWLEENEAFFYFTGESMQYSDEPQPIEVDYERKYMHKTSRIYKHDPLEIHTDDEKKTLMAFRSLKQNEKELLSAYSHKAFRQDQKLWQRWIRQPIEHQFRAVEAERGRRL